MRSWIVNICATVIFISAVELVLPDNNIKKYARFVLGLILITVVLNPILKVISFGVGDLQTYTMKANEVIKGKETELNYENYKESNITNTMNTFKSNLEIACVKELKGKYPNANYEVSIEVKYDEKSNAIDIKSASIGIKNKGIEKIKKVEITKNGESTDNNFVKENKNIIEFVSNLLNISEKLITVQKL